MARTVADAAALLDAIAAPDPTDVATKAARPAPDYTKSLDAGALKGARIGVARKKYFGYSPAADRVIDAAIAEMKAQGAVIVDPADIPTANQLDDCEFEILLYEFKADLNKYLGGLGPTAPVHSLKELIAFNQREKAREMPFFGQEILLMAEKKGPLTSAAYRTARATCLQRATTAGIDAVMTRYRLDAIVAPTGSPAWTGPRQRRPLPRRELDARRGRRLSEHHRARRRGARSAGRLVVHRPTLERSQADRAGVRIRAGHQAPAATTLRGDCADAVTKDSQSHVALRCPRSARAAVSDRR